MAYNVCVNCGTNLNHFLKIFIYEREIFEKMLINEFPNDTKEQIKEKYNYLI